MIRRWRSQTGALEHVVLEAYECVAACENRARPNTIQGLQGRRAKRAGVWMGGNVDGHTTAAQQVGSCKLVQPYVVKRSWLGGHHECKQAVQGIHSS